MGTFITEHLLEIVFALISTGALAGCKYLSKQLKNYKILLENEKREGMDEAIETKLQPIKEEIEELRNHVLNTEIKNQEHLDLIVSSYRFRLIQLCRAYIKQGYTTQEQYEQLSEFYRVYHGLGGNGQAEEYYNKAMDLPTREQE